MLTNYLRVLGRTARIARMPTRTFSTRTVIARPFLATPAYLFSTGQTRQFKTETKKLLDIVAKSLYTDSEVFVRELLSNSSDALQKQRFRDQSDLNLSINVDIYPNKNQLIIQDNGIGMSRDSLIEHLGTIAKSGSKEFIQSLENQSGQVRDNIIGQFGVGFYSAFVVADHVEVFSREEGGPTHLWQSDGSGTYKISEADRDETLQRGTKIVLHMKEECKQFLQKTTIQQIIQKYSNFINFPIMINDQIVNLVKPIWTRAKSQITQEEYQQFFEYLTNGAEKYQYKMHFSSDVPLSLKAVLYIPKNHTEQYGFSQEKGEVSLYSKKVLIKKDCKEVLLPHFLRFVKGVVDCQDIPLNISRETYQDTALIAKLKTFLTKKLIKQLKDQAEKNPQEYNKWFSTFSMYIKEGSMSQEFKNDVIDLNRYELNTEEGYFSIKDYVSKKKSTQDCIFYVTSASRLTAEDNPYVYSLSKAGIPVIIATTHFEDMIFQQMGTYQGLKFANVETQSQAVERALKGAKEEKGDKDEKKDETGVPEEDLTSFSLWIKNELQPYVQKVVVSNRALLGPALVVSKTSSAMRQMEFMRAMMEEQAKAGKPRMDLRNLTFEFDKSNDLIVSLNEHRKDNQEDASMIIRQLFDNACMQAGLSSDPKNMINRINKMMRKIIDKKEKSE